MIIGYISYSCIDSFGFVFVENVDLFIITNYRRFVYNYELIKTNLEENTYDICIYIYLHKLVL